MESLFFFSQINGLDNAPVSQITSVSQMGDKITFVIVDYDGNRIVKTRRENPFIKTQIEGYKIEIFKTPEPSTNPEDMSTTPSTIL